MEIKMRSIIKFLVTFTLALTLASFARAEDQSKAGGNFNVKQTGEIEQVIHDYLLAHPEVLSEMSQKLQLQQQQAEELRMANAAKGVQPVYKRQWPSAKVRCHNRAINDNADAEY